ncbi:MAG TPA: M3 family peptidase, partial [Allosphingosinicella sp.]
MKTVLLASATALALGGCTSMGSESPAPATVSATAPDAAPQSAVPDNILLADWQGPYDGVPPFDKVSPELFPEAIQFGIDEQRREVLAIAENPAAPTFANTVEALEKTGRRLGRVLSLFGVMTSNMTTPAYQALDKEWSPKLSAANDEIILNEKLFARIKAVYEGRESSGLDAKQQRLVTRLYDSYVRRGANLDATQKAQLSAFNQQLAATFANFSEKVLADESTYITATEAELKGVPADVKAAAASAASERKLPAGSYAIVNTRSAVDPILTFADNRALREKVWRAFVNRGDNAAA